jgi:hypothetical protein
MFVESLKIILNMEILKKRKIMKLKISWSPQNSKGKEWIILWYETPVIPTKIKIYETYNPGSCVKVSARDPNFEWFVLWSGNRQENLKKSFINEIALKRVDFLIDEIKLEIEKSEGFYQVDAVKLIGEESLELSILKKKERKNQQWVFEATASSYFVGCCPKNLIGKPSTFPNYGDLTSS